MSKMHPLDRILNDMRNRSKNPTELGEMFANLMMKFLRVDPVQKQQFKNVWKYSDWAREKGINTQDIGIDLVGECTDGSGYAAIQCKCRSESSRPASKDEVDSFLALSSKKYFSRRMFIDTTTTGWGKNLEETLRDQSPPVIRLNLFTLKESTDWNEYIKSKKIKPKPRKNLLDYQKEAVKRVVTGFNSNNRGKLIMACGTGKTFVSLKIAEKVAGKGGRVLVLMPSLALVSQCIREWSQDTRIGLRSFAVCSDKQVGIQRSYDSENPIDIERHDLEFPATTTPQQLAVNVKKKSPNKMTVVFCTYQSTQVISDAQKNFSLLGFDLIVFDEAHRTTGIIENEYERGQFQLAHMNNVVRAKKRLYMTATPRVYGPKAQEKADLESVELCSMDDSTIYGPDFYTLNFDRAVRKGLLSDFKVVIFGVDENSVNRNMKRKLLNENELDLDMATKIVGCYKAILKESDDFKDDTDPMQKSIAFCNTIKFSKMFSSGFNLIVNEYIKSTKKTKKSKLKFEVEHIDGTSNANDRNKLLNWLGMEEESCKILSNARCLSEGVDVPSLDAIIFLHPRRSQIDVVQSVGRVMRKYKGKKYGYVIIPVVISLDEDPDEILKDGKYKSIWQILNALRSHDQSLYDAINQSLDEENDRIGITVIVDEISISKNGNNIDEKDENSEEKGADKKKSDLRNQLKLFNEKFKSAMKVMIVKKCGDREYWEKWARKNEDRAIQEITGAS